VDTPVPLAASGFDLRGLAGYDHQDLFATRRRGHRAGHQRASQPALQSVAAHRGARRRSRPSPARPGSSQECGSPVSADLFPAVARFRTLIPRRFQLPALSGDAQSQTCRMGIRNSHANRRLEDLRHRPRFERGSTPGFRAHRHTQERCSQGSSRPDLGRTRFRPFRDCELKSLTLFSIVPYRSDWNAVSTQAFPRADGSGGVAAESSQSRILS